MNSKGRLVLAFALSTNPIAKLVTALAPRFAERLKIKMPCDHKPQHFGEGAAQIIVCTECGEQLGGPKCRQSRIDLLMARIFKERAGIVRQRGRRGFVDKR